jgi:hypothetical protein
VRNLIFLCIVGCVVFIVFRMFNVAPPTSSALKNGIYTSVDEFSIEFNKTAKKFGSPNNIKDIEIKEDGAKKTFEYHFDNTSSFVGQVNSEDNSLSSVTFIDLGDRTSQSNYNIIQMISILIMTTNPTITPDDRLKIFKELGVDITGGANPYTMQGEAVQNDLKYTASSDESIGIVFSIEHAL